MPPRGLPLPAGAVDRENYLAKAIEFYRASGRSNGDHPVIYRDRGSLDAWVAWMAFLTQLGVPHAGAEARGHMTVPAEFPWDFSADADGLYVRIDDLVSDERQRRATADSTITPERRAEMAALVKSKPLQMREVSRQRRRSSYVPPSRFDDARSMPDLEAPLTLSPDLKRNLSSRGYTVDGDTAEVG